MCTSTWADTQKKRPSNFVPLHTILNGLVAPFLFPYIELCTGLLCVSSPNCDFCWFVHCKCVFYIFGGMEGRAMRVDGKEEDRGRPNTSLESSVDLDLSLTASPVTSLSWIRNQASPKNHVHSLHACTLYNRESKSMYFHDLPMSTWVSMEGTGLPQGH